MAKTLEETKFCDACGADIRPGSLFCYNCGGSVSAKPANTSRKNKKEKISNAWLKDEIVEVKPLITAKLDLPITEPLVEKPGDTPIPKPGIYEDAKLKSAANLRRKSKTFQRKSVEVVWVEPESVPNVWFLVVSLILVGLVAGIYFLAMYFK